MRHIDKCARYRCIGSVAFKQSGDADLTRGRCNFRLRLVATDRNSRLSMRRSDVECHQGMKGQAYLSPYILFSILASKCSCSSPETHITPLNFSHQTFFPTPHHHATSSLVNKKTELWFPPFWRQARGLGRDHRD